MDRIANTVEANIKYWKRSTRRQEDIQELDYEFNLNHSVTNTARNINADAIFAYTQTGDTPRMLASFLPQCPIYAFTSTKKTYEQLSLVWNVTPILVLDKKEPNDIIEEGIKIAKESGYVKEGQIAIIAGGASILSSYSGDETINKVIGGILKI